jgi:hypothetical protein
VPKYSLKKTPLSFQKTFLCYDRLGTTQKKESEGEICFRRPEKMFGVIREGEAEATRMKHEDPKPVPGGMETLAYRHNAKTDATAKPKL